ncbi:MarR family winged helix-turn-helix transcriptional regulator [Aquipuribacter sp. SD81]|uniref:MarR family winged helix-turn-helix transcriptional regulator n=1 Tax=Aquipuribacter sp. SD81 TaxID=3127703 RepID=UPI00301A1FF3
MSGTGGTTEPNLALALLRAADWFDEALRARLADGGVALTRSQAQVFAALEPAGSTTADLARRVGVTRQSMHRQVAELVSLGLLTTDADARDARLRVVRLTRVGAAVVRRARRELVAVEAELAERVGEDHVAALRDVLAQDWGSPPGPPERSR